MDSNGKLCKPSETGTFLKLDADHLFLFQGNNYDSNEEGDNLDDFPLTLSERQNPDKVCDLANQLQAYLKAKKTAVRL